jgi:SAM-dependent methyltransferase
VTVDDIMATIDRDGFAELAARHAGDYAAKYLDLSVWIPRNLRRVELARLDVGPPRRVLDLGCGCGYFLHICRMLGHEIVGLDNAPPGSLFADMTEFLGIPVVQYEIQAFHPLPDLGGPFDVVAAHMVTFNGHLTATPWGAHEWHSLLWQFRGAAVSLQLNREPDGTVLPPDAAALFESQRAEVAGYRVYVPRYR